MTLKNYYSTVTRLLVLLAAVLRVNAAAGQQTIRLENDLYRMEISANGSMLLTPKGASSGRLFTPTFMIMHREDDPHLRNAHVKDLAFVVPGWNTLNGKDAATNFFTIADTVTVNAVHWEIKGREIRWTFAKRQDFTLQASLSLPSGAADPVISYQLQAIKPGWYTAGYTGAPQVDPGQINEIWQPLIWQERRFPYQPFLSMEFMCTIPGTLVNASGYTVGVVADPAEIPFRFPTMKNSRFGVLLRNAAGNAQPMIFSPVPGQEASRLQAGDQVSFRLRLVVRKETLFDTYKYIARHILDFHDYRENVGCSLNGTLNNMISYAMNDFYSGWNAELKAPDYSTDVPGTVKLVSALHPLSIAMITDNRQIYTRRALPMIEYLMSREKYLFSTNANIKGQSPSHYMKGPAAEVSELAALYEMSGKRSSVFRQYAEQLNGKPRKLNLNMVSAGESWQNALALYRMNGQQEYLQKAKAGADEYISTRIDKLQTDFSDVHIPAGGQFWTDFAPKWIDLLELYETTKEKRYLDAAAKGASRFVQYNWMEPVPPAGEMLINKGGVAPMNAYQNRLNPAAKPMKAPEQEVPAWRLSQTGLISEASTTYIGNRAVFLAHYAAYLLRLAYYTGDTYFRDIARAAVVGRYTNFPGYSIMGQYTTLYSRPDYPLRPMNEITYNNIYYNHVWPQISLLMDFLISDAFVLSKGKISFPDHYAQGYAYLQSKVYGDKPGTFYTDKNVQLWLPEKMLRSSNIQANYLAGYGNGNLYIALMNQSPATAKVKIELNPDIVPFDRRKTYAVRLWKDNGAMEKTIMQQGEITVPLKGYGITAFSIDGLPVSPQFQDEITASGQPLSEQSYASSDTPLGKVTGMIIDMGTSLSSAYIYLQATENELQKATLHYHENGKWKVLQDSSYPYEFSIALPDSVRTFDYWVEGINKEGTVLHTDTLQLKR